MAIHILSIVTYLIRNGARSPVTFGQLFRRDSCCRVSPSSNVGLQPIQPRHNQFNFTGLVSSLFTSLSQYDLDRSQVQVTAASLTAPATTTVDRRSGMNGAKSFSASSTGECRTKALFKWFRWSVRKDCSGERRERRTRV
jgi:hypothetical protein